MTKASSRLETAFSAVLVIVAIAMLSLYLHDRAQVNAARLAATVVADWETLAATGIPGGGSNDAPLVITAFMDFTCPFCSQMASVIDSLVGAHPQKFRAVFHYFPLRGQELAIPAAIAAECAREQGRFRDVYKALFAHQDSIGAWAWADFAEEAGVPDLDAYSDCVSRPDTEFTQIAAGRRAGEEGGVRGTPTIWLNGDFVTARSVADFKELARRHKVKLP